MVCPVLVALNGDIRPLWYCYPESAHPVFGLKCHVPRHQQTEPAEIQADTWPPIHYESPGSSRGWYLFSGMNNLM